MGIFRGTTQTSSVSKQAARKPGTYEAELVEIQAGRLQSQFDETPKPVLRFVFADEQGRLNVLANLPRIKTDKNGEVSLLWNERGRFWSIVGALWGRPVGQSEAALIAVDIPGVESPKDLEILPDFREEGPIKGVHIYAGEECISEAGQRVLLTVKEKEGKPVVTAVSKS